MQCCCPPGTARKGLGQLYSVPSHPGQSPHLGRQVPSLLLLPGPGNGTTGHLAVLLRFLLLLYLQHSCGHQVLLASLLVTACSHPHYRWPSLGLPSHNLPQPLYGRPGFESPPTPTPCGMPLGWLLTVSYRAESEFPVQFVFFSGLTYLHFPLLPCATHASSSITTSTFLPLGLPSCCLPACNAHLPLSVRGLLSEVIPAPCRSLPAVVEMKVLPALHPRGPGRPHRVG